MPSKKIQSLLSIASLPFENKRTVAMPNMVEAAKGIDVITDADKPLVSQVFN